MDRRRFKRVKAPVLCRPAGTALRSTRNDDVLDLSRGGLRVYTDDPHQPGEHLEIELFLPGGATLTLACEVVWVDVLPEGAPAKFDVGLQFVAQARSDLELLKKVLADGD